MDGLIKRDKNAIPFLSKVPKMTEEYKIAIDDLFFSKNICSYGPNDSIIFLGSPIMIKEQIETFEWLPPKPSNLVVISGGLSPAYKKIGPEFIGAAVIEILKGTFSFDLKKPEARRVIDILCKRMPKLASLNIYQECRSTNTYENIENSLDMIKSLNGSPNIVLAATIEQLPRAIETFKTIAGAKGLDFNAKGMPINPEVQSYWAESFWWRRRFHAEVLRLEKYSNLENAQVINHIKLSPAIRTKLQAVLELSGR